MLAVLRSTGPALRRSLAPALRPLGQRVLIMLGLALVYLGAAKMPFPSGLPFQAYLFWPTAAVAHTAFFILGRDAWVGLALGSLALNLGGWLPWPQALAMTLVQTLEPWVAWRLLLRLGVPAPNPGVLRDLLRWLWVAAACSAFFSATLGAGLVAQASGLGFHHPLATSFSWFLGDLAALLCLGPCLLHCLGPHPTPPPSDLPAQVSHPWLEGLALVSLCLLLLLGARINPSLSPDFALALQFALVLPALWLALRFGPRGTAFGVALLSLCLLALLWSRGLALPQEAFRFSQLFLIVLALAALVTSAAAEEARASRQALQVHELQGHRMEAVATLAGGLVHGFNNQLTVLLGNLDRLRLLLPPIHETGPILARLDASVQDMEATVQQLRGLSQQAPLRAFSLPLHEALAPFLDEVSTLPAGISFVSDLGEPCLVDLDPILLRQALQLLLANSLEAMGEVGTLRLEARQDDHWVHLALADSGPGMAPELLRRAFDPYFSTRSVGRNRGLGLPIAFSLARQMGGWLTLYSQPGQGTRAELGLPLGKPFEQPSSAPASRSHTGRVLLADDEAGIRELAREVLQAEGFTVVEAADGQAALETFEAAPHEFDVAILDLVMPRLHGAEVLLRLQALRPELPVVLMSGYSAEMRPGLLDPPHRRFLAKPFRIQELLDALSQLGLPSPSRVPHDGQ